MSDVGVPTAAAPPQIALEVEGSVKFRAFHITFGTVELSGNKYILPLSAEDAETMALILAKLPSVPTLTANERGIEATVKLVVIQPAS